SFSIPTASRPKSVVCRTTPQSLSRKLGRLKRSAISSIERPAPVAKDRERRRSSSLRHEFRQLFRGSSFPTLFRRQGSDWMNWSSLAYSSGGAGTYAPDG